MTSAQTGHYRGSDVPRMPGPRAGRIAVASGDTHPAERGNGGPMNSTTAPFCNRLATRLRPASLLLGALIALCPATRAWSVEPDSAPKPVSSWQDAEQMTAEELARVLRTTGAEKPAMFHVGFRVLFAQAHIPASQIAGPGANQAGLDALRRPSLGADWDTYQVVSASLAVVGGRPAAHQPGRFAARRRRLRLPTAKPACRHAERRRSAHRRRGQHHLRRRCRLRVEEVVARRPLQTLRVLLRRFVATRLSLF